jgi:hypothetical protein
VGLADVTSISPNPGGLARTKFAPTGVALFMVSDIGTALATIGPITGTATVPTIGPITMVGDGTVELPEDGPA